jgi:hypothetical protein
MEKIDRSAVVVSDITSVGAVFGSSEESPKKLINSNVAIELGYAFKSIGHRRIVLVFNEHYGSYSDVPFDLRHKGGAIRFRISPHATKEEIRKEQARHCWRSTSSFCFAPP